MKKKRRPDAASGPRDAGGSNAVVAREPGFGRMAALATAIALLAGAAYSLFLSRAFRWGNVDDAYIAFRYGRNLMLGHGLVFNPGDPVEGYTSFVWTVLMAPFTRGPLDIAWFSIPLGILASLATIAGASVHARRLIARGAHPWLVWAPLVLALDDSHAFWAVSGLETSLFTALLVWSSAVVLGGEGSRRSAIAGLLVGLAALTRPEGLLFAGLLALWQWRRSGVRDAAWLAAACALLVVPHLAWRLWYYHDWVPNTFHVKVGLGYASLRLGATYLGNFVMWRYAAVLAALIALAYPEARRRQMLHWLLLVPYLGYVLVVGGDWQVANRFMVPVLPFIVLIALDAVLTLFTRPVLRAAAMAAFGLGVVVGSYLNGEAYGMVRRNDNVAVEGQRKQFGLWLRGAVPPGSLVAAGPAGAIPYYSELPCLDMWGLTDRHIARVPASDIWPGHTRADPAYVLSRAPVVIVGVAGFDAANLPPGYLVANPSVPEASRPLDLVLLRVR